jgi:acyl dehydratase
MQVDDIFDDIATMGGRGVNDLRWPVPVRPGDTLSGTLTVADRRSTEHDDRGDIHYGDTVLSMYNLGIVRRRPAGGDGG